MAHVVVLGAGIGGLTAAYDMKERLRPGDTVTVVTEKSYFQFTPSNPWLAVNWRTREDITFELAPCLERKNIRLASGGAKRVHPDRNQIELVNGGTIDYDYLIIATGPKLAFGEVPGAGPDGGHTRSICTVDHAVDSAKAWEAFIRDPGHIVVGAVQDASCYGPAYEFAFIMDTDLRRRRIRSKVPMTLVTAEPYVGHLGLGGVGDSKGLLESFLRDKHIKWICNARVNRVEAGKMYVTEHDEDGKPKKDHELSFKYSMMLPAFRGVDAVFGIEGLTNPRGFILIDEFQRNPRFRNIYAVGVCVAIPPVEATPVPTNVPKTGYMIETMVTAAVRNIRNAVDGREPDQKATWNAVCLVDFGDNGAAFVAIPQAPPRNVSWFKKGKWVHLAKIGFEKYFIHKMKKGNTEPVYEKYVLKLMGVTRLHD
ncbi:MAG: NAD(P)/FAD-dependent oxidoreductase [Candidatus Nitricoxidivorans perseverans]|uniref:Sulfide-quinone reductase n=1 Tax=Candidatus Nitricoxidivorans perseverans TaxID=2975601 RepID=A0AA49FJ86_9PROT|nr:MAG: NAD(P)/FAD-dependent oxidoreductase [Candidatus Nitricoxidivorans perseverans]